MQPCKTQSETNVELRGRILEASYLNLNSNVCKQALACISSKYTAGLTLKKSSRLDSTRSILEIQKYTG